MVVLGGGYKGDSAARSPRRHPTGSGINLLVGPRLINLLTTLATQTYGCSNPDFAAVGAPRHTLPPTRPYIKRHVLKQRDTFCDRMINDEPDTAADG